MTGQSASIGTGGSFTQAEDAIQWIIGLVQFGIKPGLKRMEIMLDRLNHPERRLKFIHVAGTNGKGSTCAFLTKILHKSGYDVGTFTSPFLERYTNRIRYNEADIPDDVLVEIVNRIKPIVDEMTASEWGSPTMFEVSTVLALLYFATVSYPDFVIWETGLGGRLDSTNVVAPLVSIITNIGHDHMDILGDSLEKVALEKAGIIKAGVPVVTCVEQPELIALLKDVCQAKKSTLYVMDEQYSYEPISSDLNHQVFHFNSPFRRIADLAISMNGRHQFINAAAALMAVEILRQYYALLIEDETLLEALRETHWPGRLEMVSTTPRILLDGAHNPEGAAALADALTTIYSYRKLIIMTGMLSTKDHSGFLGHILPLADKLIVTEPDFHKRLKAGLLAERAQQWLDEAERSIEMVVEPDWKKALSLLAAETGPDDLAVVSGTLYLISDVRSWILYKAHSEKGW